MLIKPKLEYTALLGDKIEISLQNFAIEQRISGIVFCLNNIFISRVEYQPFLKGVRLRLVFDSGPVHTYIRIFFNPLFFLSGFDFSPHVSGESGIRTRNFLNPLSIMEIFEYAMNLESCGR